MSADFSNAAAALGQGITDHADRDGLTGVARAVFIDRGRHAPGESCPTVTDQISALTDTQERAGEGSVRIGMLRAILASDWLAQRDKDRDAAVAAKVASHIRTHNGTPVTAENLRYAATHEALCRSWIFEVLTGLADALDGDT